MIMTVVTNGKRRLFAHPCMVKDCPENKTGVILLTRSCIYSMNSGGKDNLQQNSLFKLLKNLPFWILLVKALK